MQPACPHVDMLRPDTACCCARAAGACRKWLPLQSCRTERQLHPQTHPWRLVDLKGSLFQDYIATAQEQQTVQVKAQPGGRPAADLDASSHQPFRGFDGLGRSQQEYLGAEVSFQTAGSVGLGAADAPGHCSCVSASSALQSAPSGPSDRRLLQRCHLPQRLLQAAASVACASAPPGF